MGTLFISYSMELNNINEIAEALQKLLAGQKPGQSAHEKMIPKGRLLVPNSPIPARQSAVMLLLYPKNGQVYFPLIRRPVYDGMHSGQMAFPGGKHESGDANLIQTAIRECCEEVGVCLNKLEILGTLTEIYIQVTHYQVLPVVGILQEAPTFKLDTNEVDAVFEIPLIEILNPQLKKTENWNLRGTQVDVPFYLLGNQKVWGATAMILGEFEEVLKTEESKKME